VLGQRLMRAHRMLSDPRFAGLSVSAIAFAAGFGDLSYFSSRCTDILLFASQRRILADDDGFCGCRPSALCRVGFDNDDAQRHNGRTARLDNISGRPRQFRIFSHLRSYDG
jgi:AraC-like DNA-binding protein